MERLAINNDPFHVPPHLFGAGHCKEVMAMPAPHAHSQVELNFVLTGSFAYLFGGQTVQVNAGDFVFFWGAVPHRTVAVAEPGEHGPTTFVCVYVPIDRFLSLPLQARLTAAVLGGALVAAGPARPFDPEQVQRMHAELVGPDPRLVALDRAELEHMLRRVDLTGWRDLLGRTGDSPPLPGAAHAKAIAMARFMSEHATESLTVAEVAGHARLHPNYAMTVFRSAVGMTIGAYLLRQRLHLAQTLLATTRDDVASVAFACGFGSLSRFHAAFTRHFETSPGRFRNAIAAAA